MTNICWASCTKPCALSTLYGWSHWSLGSNHYVISYTVSQIRELDVKRLGKFPMAINIVKVTKKGHV